MSTASARNLPSPGPPVHTVCGRSADQVGAGREALARGRWEEARARFRDALGGEETAEALEGLSWAAWWLDDADGVFEARRRALCRYRRGGDRAAAARLAMWLASDFLEFDWQVAVANGWFRRARRLLEGLDDAPERGWLALHEGAFALAVRGDSAAGRRLGAQALEFGRRVGVIDVEMLGLALEGESLVSQGEVDGGMHRLDEAAAAALGGELEHLISVGWACRSLLSACEAVRDIDRAAQWWREVEAFSERFRSDFLLGACGAQYAALLIWRGRWEEAETVLLATMKQIAGRPRLALKALARLGELRRRQGRAAEAAELFRRAGAHPVAIAGQAALALDGGDPTRAAEIVERFAPQTCAETWIHRAELLEQLVESRAAARDVDGAGEALAELVPLAELVGAPPLSAGATRARGLVASAAGDHEEARRTLGDAVALLERSGLPFEAAGARMRLTAPLAALGRAPAAEREAGAALASLEELGAARAAERARALLTELRSGAPPGRAVAPAPSRPARTEALLRRDGEYWTVGFGGDEVRMRDSKGLRYLAELLANPGHEFHVLDLVGLERGARGVNARVLDVGQAGEVGLRVGGEHALPALDAQAKAQYRQRIEELRAELDEAEAFHDPERVARAREELHFLARELAGAVGLAGRDRVTASHSERARSSVGKAIKSAQRKLCRASPPLGHYLTATVRTGTFCSFTPEHGAPVSWQVDPRPGSRRRDFPAAARARELEPPTGKPLLPPVS
jgi:LuxR family maltose regulon positive regulatory protein